MNVNNIAKPILVREYAMIAAPAVLGVCASGELETGLLDGVEDGEIGTGQEGGAETGQA
jgi:hypothetical protein